MRVVANRPTGGSWAKTNGRHPQGVRRIRRAAKLLTAAQSRSKEKMFTCRFGRGLRKGSACGYLPPLIRLAPILLRMKYRKTAFARAAKFRRRLTNCFCACSRCRYPLLGREIQRGGAAAPPLCVVRGCGGEVETPPRFWWGFGGGVFAPKTSSPRTFGQGQKECGAHHARRRYSFQKRNVPTEFLQK